MQSYHPLNTEEAQKIWKILQNLSLSCRLTNCSCKLDPDLVEKFCRQASYDYITSFEEAYNTGVLHCGWAHLGNNSLTSIKNFNIHNNSLSRFLKWDFKCDFKITLLK